MSTRLCFVSSIEISQEIALELTILQNQRVREIISMEPEDPNTVVDLREVRSKESKTKFKEWLRLQFWSKMKNASVSMHYTGRLHVCFMVDIPNDIHESWYRGQVMVGFKDAAFEASCY